MPLAPAPEPLTVTVTIQYGDDEPEVRTYTPDTVTIDRDTESHTRPGGALREDVHTTIVRMETRTLDRY